MEGVSEKRLLVRTGAEVAAAFGVQPPAVSKWVNEGMPVVDLGGTRWYDLDDIYEWKVARESALIATNNGQRLAPAVVDAMPVMGELKARVEEFKVNRGDILAAEQMSSLDIQRRIKKLKLADLSDEQLMKLTNTEAARWFQLLGVDFAIKFDKESLERNKGVDNISKILGIINQLKEVDGQSPGDD